MEIYLFLLIGVVHDAGHILSMVVSMVFTVILKSSLTSFLTSDHVDPSPSYLRSLSNPPTLTSFTNLYLPTLSSFLLPLL